MNLYNIKDKSEQVSFAQAVRQGLGREQGSSSQRPWSRWPTWMPAGSAAGRALGPHPEPPAG